VDAGRRPGITSQSGTMSAAQPQYIASYLAPVPPDGIGGSTPRVLFLPSQESLNAFCALFLMVIKSAI